MTHSSSHNDLSPARTTQHDGPVLFDDFDFGLVDDDFIDRHIAGIRESLADFRTQ